VCRAQLAEPDTEQGLEPPGPQSNHLDIISRATAGSSIGGSLARPGPAALLLVGELSDHRSPVGFAGLDEPQHRQGTPVRVVLLAEQGDGQHDRDQGVHPTDLVRYRDVVGGHVAAERCRGRYARIGPPGVMALNTGTGTSWPVPAGCRGRSAPPDRWTGKDPRRVDGSTCGCSRRGPSGTRAATADHLHLTCPTDLRPGKGRNIEPGHQLPEDAHSVLRINLEGDRRVTVGAGYCMPLKLLKPHYRKFLKPGTTQTLRWTPRPNTVLRRRSCESCYRPGK
jgi:hypothetical protein